MTAGLNNTRVVERNPAADGAHVDQNHAPLSAVAFENDRVVQCHEKVLSGA
jgi:hypothetical protein